jgi:peptide/nickel transport system ATP-binding protein
MSDRRVELQRTGSDPLLDVRSLRVDFRRRGVLARRSVVHAVRDVSFQMDVGETFGLVGESGSGKSTTARAILRLVRASGQVRFQGEDVLTASRARLRAMRPGMQMIFQDPYSSIDPSQTVAQIVAEPLVTHTSLGRLERTDRVTELLQQVGLGAAHLPRYPHEFSGGQRQRIALARAIALNPELVVCDEAVSALDVSTQNQVINLLEDLSERHQVAYLFITHNLAVVRHIAHRIGVMYLGRLVEVAPTRALFSSPAHPYTQALLAAMPVVRPGGRSRTEASVVRGELPDPANPPAGCSFHPRCPAVMDVCRVVEPSLAEIGDGRTVACHLWTGDAIPVTLGSPTATTRRVGEDAAMSSLIDGAAGGR